MQSKQQGRTWDSWVELIASDEWKRILYKGCISSILPPLYRLIVLTRSSTLLNRSHILWDDECFHDSHGKYAPRKETSAPSLLHLLSLLLHTMLNDLKHMIKRSSWEIFILFRKTVLDEHHHPIVSVASPGSCSGVFTKFKEQVFFVLSISD